LGVHKSRLESFSLLALFAAVSVLLFFVFSPFIQLLAEPGIDGNLFNALRSEAQAIAGQLKARGALPYVQADVRIMFDIQDLDRWIEQNKNQDSGG